MKETQPTYHELNFLRTDLVGGFLNKDTLRFIKNIRSSFKKDEKRNFAQDVEKIIERLKYEIRGLDNIPQSNDSSLIIEMNHPPIRDFLEGAFFISYFSPDSIHWFIGENIPRRNLRHKKIIGPIFEKTLFKGIDSILKSIIETYDFIGVPTKDMENANSKRPAALRKGIKLLQDNQWVGILPEAEFEKNNQLEPFHDGIGLMIKSVKDKNLRVLPVRVWRNKEKMLHIIIGQSYKPDYHQKVEVLTQQAKEALENLSL
ncbi:hypothetical protein COY29_05105 [Candidatus Woesebacteria bacterium CG_4_10_14_0_2_um_filter_39_14]|uniref:Phospholipid/glycerol acyltransferase domain-containing protein n=3 Tax=Microgenomates group TaxID=1794810 RepID=A0A2M6YQE3_9BACT|nr:MAG: hypothetical protein COT04_00620 [Candidatus Shapirobacteria bacterium CG07_land_8_20_14_0_80_39_12]PIZ47521.1 MAG: hypothetical protein COY29_05105 [Candidatus Woesebacteria bacterium CG_4_10_14_0_2_um_filter_39_14]PJA49938.1 MAG: hypothetical protein CO169_00545 [Candidatus Shapirobacteria bacterium CG_4_9_14_3_um_filter_39_13]